MLLFILNLAVGGLDLLELFFCLCFIRIVNVCVRMILAAQLPIGLLDFLIGGIPRNTQDLIGICHSNYLFSFVSEIHYHTSDSGR